VSINIDQPLLPIRRLHNYVYCPRLFFLQWVENIFIENVDTISGTSVHKRVDQPSRILSEDSSTDISGKIRSLALESTILGITGVIDLLEEINDELTIVEYKKGSPGRDENDQRIVKENDQIQVIAQALLLKEHGYEPKRACVYYGEERRRFEVELSPGLEKKCLNIIQEAKELAKIGVCPPPLKNDPRCEYCSAYPVCLPNESHFWSNEETDGLYKETEGAIDKPLRPPLAEKDHREVLVVQTPGASIGRRSGQIIVSLKGEPVKKLPLKQVRGIYVYGPVQISTQVVTSCLEEGIALDYFAPSGRFLGSLTSLNSTGIIAKKFQYKLFDDENFCLSLSKAIVEAKIFNQRLLLKRNADLPKSTLDSLNLIRKKVGKAGSIEELLGLEGAAASIYFQNFGNMLKSKDSVTFDFSTRNRRPPRDPVNALLSLAYSILTKELTGVCYSVGLDPFFGFYHKPRYGKPALALDLMEEFRPLTADSVVISLINRNELSLSDFTSTSRGTFLNERGRKVFWEAWFRRLDTEVKHPVFGYRMSYRRMFEIQARQLWRYVQGQAKSYTGFTTR
jgi:CRISP-associated protein Cas1